jgi:hypothetical protein
LHSAELSLVAVPGIPETNIQIMEKLQAKEQVYEPIIAGEYILGFYQDASAFMPEHFTTIWLDKQNGILAVMGKLRNQPEVQRTQAIFFAKEKLWDQIKIKDWLALHANYTNTISVSHNLLDKDNILETLIKKPSEPALSINDVIGLMESVLPSPIVQRSWSFGPQRMCQEMRRIILKLHNLRESYGGEVASS